MLFRSDETVEITLGSITAGDAGITIGTATDTINIVDNDSATVSIAGTTNANEAGVLPGQFTVETMYS